MPRPCAKKILAKWTESTGGPALEHQPPRFGMQAKSHETEQSSSRGKSHYAKDFKLFSQNGPESTDSDLEAFCLLRTQGFEDRQHICFSDRRQPVCSGLVDESTFVPLRPRHC